MAGGALLCEGCTRHFLLYMKDALSQYVPLQPFVKPANGYVWNKTVDTDNVKPTGCCKGLTEIGGTMSPYIPGFDQSVRASAHTDTLIECVANLNDTQILHRCHEIRPEARAMLAFQKLGYQIAKGKSLPPPWTLTAFMAVYHNLVTAGVAEEGFDAKNAKVKYSIPGKTYYSPKQACASLKTSHIFKDLKDTQGFSCELNGLDEKLMPGSYLWLPQ
jgi:YHS domain-containing protein